MTFRTRVAVAAAFALAALATAAPALAIGNTLDKAIGKPDLDARAGRVAATTAQQQLVSGLGAHATWNRFGTPQSLIRYGGYLATGLGSDPVAAARAFVASNKALFRLSDQGVA